MNSIISFAIALFQGLTYMLIAPGVVGILRWMKARLQGRQGPTPIQPYRDLWKLFHLRPIISETTSWLFGAIPPIIFVLSLLPGIFMPLFYLDRAPVLHIDLLTLFYILALVPFLLTLAGFDSGSPFAGLGSSRTAYMQFLSEPILLLIILALAMDQGTTNLNEILNTYGQQNGLHLLNSLSLWFILAALCLVIMIETGRIPIDNPDAHLELTMISQGVLFEYGGPHLALLEWAEAMRLTFFMTLIINLLMPSTLPTSNWPLEYQVIGIIIFAIKLPLLAGGLAIWELSRERLRLRQVSNLAGIAFFFAISAAVITILKKLFFQ